MKTPAPWLVASVVAWSAFVLAAGAGADRMDVRFSVVCLLAGVVLAATGLVVAIRQRRARVAAACLACGWIVVVAWLGSRSVRSAGLGALRRIAAVNTEP